MFGSPETTPGGRALKFWASVRMKIRRVESLKQGGEVIGSRTAVQVVKNKVAPPFREATFDILFGRGISRAGDILDLATEGGLVKKTGTWFAYGDLRLGQGRENARQFLDDNPEVMAELEAALRQSFVPLPVARALEETEEEEE
jgi:recombination protein RecA